MHHLTPACVLAAILLCSACVRDAATNNGEIGSPAPPTPPSPPRDHTAFCSAVDAMAQDALRHGPIAGLSIAVFERGTTVLAKGYGLADVEAGVPATAQTSYPIASVSKNFTAALALRLVDQGRLSLDDTLSRFYPDARPQIGALTVRHLLDHTSGLTRGGPAPRDAALSVIRRGGTAHPQGETWDYSNYNYSLVGLVIERITGRSYADHVRDDVAAPLGLTGTAYCEDGTMVPGRGRDYLSGRRRVSPTAYWTKPHFFASGGLCSTVLDLVRWDQALEDGRVVSPAMLQAMRTPTRLPGSAEADYGLGTRMGATAGRRKIGHTGGGQGNKAVLARYPDERVTIAVLLNTERDKAPVTATDLEERIARLLFLPGQTAPPDGNLDAEARRFAGDYRSGAILVRMAADGGMLAARPATRPSARPSPPRRAEPRFVPRGRGIFVAIDDPSIELHFLVRDDQQVEGYRRYRNGWFAGLAIRTEDPPLGAPAASR
jgi:CubicO group peptidase (beta-lactamase class C family)